MEAEREREREKKEAEERCVSAHQAARSSVRALAGDPETCIRCARLSRLSVIFVVFLESGSVDGCVGEECVHEAGARCHELCTATVHGRPTLLRTDLFKTVNECTATDHVIFSQCIYISLHGNLLPLA